MIDTNNIEFIEKLVCVNRVTKVVKGGRNFGFAAMVVVGDKKGLVGFGTGKAKEVTAARNKATKMAKKNLVRIPLREGRTVHHDIIGKYGAGKVVVRNAPPGTGIIAGGAMRAVFEAVGIQDIVAKSLSTSNPYNLVKATFDALQKIDSPKMLAAKRGVKVSDIISKRNAHAQKEVAAEVKE
jgi:small subunit ribosomal protein S5